MQLPGRRIGNAADAVQAVALACHRALNHPDDDMARVLLLEALASYKAAWLAIFPFAVLDLVKRSHDQADALSDRILRAPASPIRGSPGS